MRIALFGDIHGNLFALQAVLTDLRRQSPDALVVTGDLVHKLPWGVDVVDLMRTVPHQSILGNAELYLTLWGTSLWPAQEWNLPLAAEVVVWERERLGAERLAWLATRPEYVALSAGRVEDLLVVHGAPGNPFLALLAAPGDDRSPWVQTEQRVRQLVAGVDADVLVCGHTHTPLCRRIEHRSAEDVGALTIVNPGALGYPRGKGAVPGEASYLLMDWSAAKGWQPTWRTVTYDLALLHSELLRLKDDYPIAAAMANRLRPPGALVVPATGYDLRTCGWGVAPTWWDRRDEYPAWNAMRQGSEASYPGGIQ